MSCARQRGMQSVIVMLALAICSLGVSIGGAAADRQPVRIGLLHTAASASLYIGISDGYFADEGLDPQLAFFNTDAAVQKAAAEGKLDFGMTTLTASFFDYAAKHE